MGASETTRGGRTGRPLVPLSVALVVVAVALWFFPLFHVRPLRGGPAGAGAMAPVVGFDAAAFAEKFWREQLIPASARAAPAAAVLTALRRDPAAAAKTHAHFVGLGGTAYYFLRGTGRVVSVGRSEVVVAVDDAEGAQVALRTGPVFGNTVRDSTGLLDVNGFPGLDDFNAVSAALNRLVETRVLPALHERAVVGASLAFAGCAEQQDGAGTGPLLSVVPVVVGEPK